MSKKVNYSGLTMQDLAEMQSSRLRKRGKKYSTEEFLLTMRSIEGLLMAACSQGAPPMLHIVGNDAVVLAKEGQPLTPAEEQFVQEKLQDFRKQETNSANNG